MKIKLLSRMAGPGGNYSPGLSLEMDAKQAKELIAGGYAVSLEPEQEAATDGNVMHDNRRKPKPRKKDQV